MKVLINEIKLNYEIYGENNKDEILLLHGWGASIASFMPLINSYKKNFKVYAIDLPGFGNTEEPNSLWTVLDYAKLTKRFIEKMHIKNPTLVGHSFGGRVIMKLVGELGYIPKNIILVDSSGIKPIRGLDYYLKVYSYKFIKKVSKFLLSKEKYNCCLEAARKKSGSTDYNSATETMKRIFINVVNEDLRYTLKNINVPTLIMWGELDTETPLRDAKIIEKEVKDSGLVILKGAGHFSYLDNLNEFLMITNNFLGKEK